MTGTEIIVAVIIAVIGSNGIWMFFAKIAEKKGKNSTEVQELKNNIEDIKDEILDITDLLRKTNLLATSTARDRLNFLSHKYMGLGYIPKNDITPYKLIGEAYKKNDGNTIVSEEFDFCMKELPRK